MNKSPSFEYYSTIAPLSATFLVAEPTELAVTTSYKILKPLNVIDNGYQYYYNRSTKKSAFKKA